MKYFFRLLQKVIEGLMSENSKLTPHHGGRIPEGPSPTALPELPGNARSQTVKELPKHTKLASESEFHVSNGDVSQVHYGDMSTASSSAAAAVHVQKRESQIESAPGQNHDDLPGVHDAFISTSAAHMHAHATGMAQDYPGNVFEAGHVSNGVSDAPTHSANVRHDEESWQIVDPRHEKSASHAAVDVPSEKEGASSSGTLQDAVHETSTHAEKLSTSTLQHAPSPPSSHVTSVDGNIHEKMPPQQQERDAHVATNNATTTHAPLAQGETSASLKDTSHETEVPLLSPPLVPHHDSSIKTLQSSPSAAPAGIQPASSAEHAVVSPSLSPVPMDAPPQGLHTAAPGKQQNATRREAPPPRPFPPEVLAHPGDKELQITLRHLDHPPVPTAPAVLTLLDTIWGVVSFRGVRSIFGNAARPQQDDDFLPSPWR
jgi:hypothetical protein